MRYETLHWRIFNMGARLFGLLAVVAGAIGIVSGLVDFETNSPNVGDPVVGLGVGALLIFMGVLFLRVRPFRPDLLKDGWTLASLATARRSFWTGEPKK
jgi:hypothetical protein